MNPLPILLLTRPEDASERFWRALPETTRIGLRPVVAPLMRIVATGARVDLANIGGVIFTSANAVAMTGKARGALPAYCVGAATSKAARDAGWDARQAGRNAMELRENLMSVRPDGPLLHLRGSHVAGDIAGALRGAGIATRECIVYDQQATGLPQTGRAALDGAAPVVAPLFSARAARLFLDLAAPRAPLYVAAISDAVATVATKLRPRELLVAQAPDAARMGACVETLRMRASRVESATRRK